MNSFKGFDSQYFAGNRAKLKAKFPSAPIVIAGNGLIQKTRDDDTYPFQQSANFWYLSGLIEPDLILVIDQRSEYVILPMRDPRMEIFSGKIDSKKIAKVSGINDLLPNSEGWSRLAQTLKQAKQIGTIKPSPEFNETYSVFTNPAPRKLSRRMKSYKRDLILIDVSPHLANLRMYKSDVEIQALKYATYHTVRMFTQITKNYASYKNERDIEAEIIYYAAKHGLKQSFAPIVANGMNACTLHYHDNDQQLKPDKLTLIDAGLSANGFCADITRVINPRPSSRQTSVYSAVLDIHNHAIGMIKPGIMPKDYEKSVAQYAGEQLIKLGLTDSLEPSEIYKHFRHRTSHFLGIDTHDVGDYQKPFAKDMVITVEPGIYIDEESIGVRIEDDVLITASGVENLSGNLSRSLNSIKIEKE